MPTTKTRRTLELLHGVVKRGRKRTDLVDFATQGATWTWHRLAFDSFDALETVMCNYEAHLAYRYAICSEEQAENAGWPLWAAETDISNSLDVSWSDGKWRWVYWALEHGVAPGQPFLVWTGQPEGHYCYSSNEYDEEYSGELISVRPLPLHLALKRWEHLLRRVVVSRALWDAHRAEHRSLVERNTAKMYVQQFLYGESNYGPPKSVGYRLETRCSPPYTLVEARSDAGNRDEAMAKLVLEACERYPRLSPEILLQIEVRR